MSKEIEIGEVTISHTEVNEASSFSGFEGLENKINTSDIQPFEVKIYSNFGNQMMSKEDAKKMADFIYENL